MNIRAGDFVKFSLFEGKYLVFGLDGATIIGRHFLKESGIQHFNAYLKARVALEKKEGKSAVLRDRGISTNRDTPRMRELRDKTDAARKANGVFSEGTENEESNIAQIFKGSPRKPS